MEIVSYVGYNNSKTDNVTDILANQLENLKKIFKSKASHKSNSRFLNIPGEFPEVSSSIAKNRGCNIDLSEISCFLSSAGKFCDFLLSNARKIITGTGVLAFLILICVVSVKIHSYIQTLASVVPFEDSYNSEMEILGKVMNDFVLEETQEYSLDGTLTGEKALSESELEKLFRKPVTFVNYRVQPGDTISGITKKFGLKNISTLIAVNDIDNVRTLCSGQKLKIPSIDGLVYTVQKGNTLAGLSTRFGVTIEDLLDVNDLDSAVLHAGQTLFIPGAKMDMSKLQQAMGEMFKCPISAKYRLTSRFGPRADPFSGARSNHTGIDMACPTGTPISATASGTVAFTGVNPVFGNYVIIKHANGYQSLYGHMSMIIAKKGQRVSQGTRIGLVGSTGYSTGPHLHFTVYKNGKLVDPMTLIK